MFTLNTSLNMSNSRLHLELNTLVSYTTLFISHIINKDWKKVFRELTRTQKTLWKTCIRPLETLELRPPRFVAQTGYL